MRKTALCFNRMPRLKTFHQRPSWVNCHGRVDRSACVEVRATDIAWQTWKRPATTLDGRNSAGIYLLTELHLRQLLYLRPSRRLVGDYRTAQANAMCPADQEPMCFRRKGLTPGLPAPSLTFGLINRNPNQLSEKRRRGPRKKLGVYAGWSQPLLVEEWQLHRSMHKNFLICPGVPPHPLLMPESIRPLHARTRQELTLPEAYQVLDERIPPLSTVERGSKLNQKTCPQRVGMLMMPTCTEQEYRDAMRAQAWLYELSLDRDYWLMEIEIIDQLVNRYGLLFHPRWLICQRCLGVRYAQGPERSRRQHARKMGISRFPTVEVRETVFDDSEEEILTLDDELKAIRRMPKNHLSTKENRVKPLSRRGTMPRMDLKNALKELEANGSEQTRKTYARHGVKSPMYGVNYATFTKLKKLIKTDHVLARQLWATGNHDARILATMIAVPTQMNEAELESWVAALDNYVLTDAVAKVAAASTYAMKKMQQWTRSTDEWTSSAGWTILAVMTTDKSLADNFFDPYLTRIEKEIHEAPNRTRHAMNGAVIAVGCRGGAAMTKAVTVAKRIGTVEVDHGETGCETPEAVGYIKKVLDHHAGKGGKTASKSAAKTNGKAVAKAKTATPKPRTASTAKKKTTKTKRQPARV